ncbi:MAG: hypothetical protein H0V17_04870 [Deltaproteobacteria bacterium]|nr:hypothetical protein [Deltaproteobacteria bacterium]
MSLWLRLLPVTSVLAVSSSAAAPPPWSTPVDGVRARLVATSTVDAAKRPQLELWLEIENVSDTDGGIGLPWGYVGDMLQLVLENDGKPVPTAGTGGSHASGPPYVVALPVGATLRVPVSKNAYEYPAANKVLFRPLTFQAWDVPAKHGKLVLRGKLSPHALDKGTKPGPRAWSTPLELPKLELP